MQRLQIQALGHFEHLLWERIKFIQLFLFVKCIIKNHSVSREQKKFVHLFRWTLAHILWNILYMSWNLVFSRYRPLVLTNLLKYFVKFCRLFSVIFYDMRSSMQPEADYLGFSIINYQFFALLGYHLFFKVDV